ncbi:hypothetical protein [Streptomyces lancefieldiae]|uniref:Secreted protein n=1 Tax=Streptomyces lancefieldiae TaxID=3075520 RepID=A0ABU3AY48_9ACTN|nr:hypothetical protein [Streptomyces sp. DSM 40712]MDT0615094.1 hypothetical protein [Streptomyces sp. DSM 40712]
MNTPGRVTPRRLGAAAAIYGVFVAGWYLGQPVTPECHVDQAALDRIAEEHGTEPSPTPPPTVHPTRYGSASPLPLGPTPDPTYHPRGGADTTLTRTLTAYAVTCTDDTSERPRLQGWFEGHWL